ncbi:LEAF RUST 10 DISEASE-RESISTANCE LOCUS RECEPTOR-LIKE PROTEIN KINASE-like 2.4 isoform X2 [Prosopis cineraria]|uniref:LEAF RUST 10 DISEASE-RESISTANCE LOCUS RECEPTOR-LIKE PROTEIN KINASE-like 2.4 isoform X2 n=1 Tax=Prosopis cineraria TaxID=364024 RepID=UPI00240F4CDB|nr:LEAF RUST 10 DISEASE-RESISTANCE LOCUS RECEPTOR-LIKE PROTEIN KINASE-like 2.4 isoform X2 [Prosopis cineraria]
MASFFTPRLILSCITLSLLHQISSYSIANDYHKACSARYDCGKISNVGFPFWGQGRPEGCGYPDLYLNCSEGSTFITIQRVRYLVLEAHPDQHILRIARFDYYSQNLCPNQLVSTSLDPLVFENVPETKYLTFLYGCPSISSISSLQLPCRKNGFDNPFGYVLLDHMPEISALCSASVVVPVEVSPSEIDSFASSIVQGILNKGFRVKWIAGIAECEKCQRTGAVCGYNLGSNQPTCYSIRDNSIRDDSTIPGSTKKRGRQLAIAISAGVGGLALILILIIYICKKHFRIENGKIFKKSRAYHDNNLRSFINNYSSLAPRKYSYSEVKRMTRSFSNKLGEGGYGVVYKASLPDGRLVAVKVVRESKGNGEEFINEVARISRTSHVNIVTLLGFCCERNKRVLIYEYMSNGSLDNFIYKRGSPNAFCILEWNVLYQVAIGIARGLEYLHRGCNTRILHLDIKPQNILLDETFCPKISDFGLAKICKESIVSILGTRGTVGFIAPEIFNRAFGGVSHKADVYSYGMLVLEMVGGRKNYDSRGSHTEEMYFPDWIYKDLERGHHPASSIVITMEDDEVVRKMTLVSLWCIQTNPLDRPAMSKVVEMLEGPLQSLSIPPKPSLESPTKSPVGLSNGSSEEIIQTNSLRS